jgi:acetyltransferase-like isoleucine patch superfamily enzyme/SAM-dependent methyltransferase
MRCSIILPASSPVSELMAYAERLSRQNIPDDYEVVLGAGAAETERLRLGTSMPNVRRVTLPATAASGSLPDYCAASARGTYLLFVQQIVDFSLGAVDESIRELEGSGNELSISQTGRFVLVTQSLYRRAGHLQALFEQLGSGDSAPRPTAPGATHGTSTFIDPDVTIDSPERVRIGANCVICRGVVLRSEGGEIVIGDHCVIDHYCILHGQGGIYIGDWTRLEPHCGLYAQGHTCDRFDVPLMKQGGRGRGIYLMGDSRIGASTVICDDVTIGKGTVVSPNSVVTESLPMACMAGGFPARLSGKRHQGAWETHKQERAAAEGMPNAVCQHVMERASLIEQLVEPGDCVLDVGCGEGLITAMLAKKAANVVGCDYSKEAVQIARQRCPNVEFVCCNSTNLPFADGSFGKVTLSDVAEHLMPVQFIKTIENIHRVLRPAGVLVLATPLTGRGASSAHYAHIYEYSLAEMRQILERFFCDVQHVNKKFGLVIARRRPVPAGMAEARESPSPEPQGASVLKISL